ncbi:MAG: hypothetical protein ACOY3Z_11785 [Thermodesulfobacteriota bacterium]
MSDETTKCIPYELAKKLVGGVMEEEHLHESNRRVLTVYDTNEQEICWFDAEEIMREMAESEGGIPRNEDEMKAKAVEMIMHQIPEWAVENLLARMGQSG